MYVNKYMCNNNNLKIINLRGIRDIEVGEGEKGSRNDFWNFFFKFKKFVN